MPTLTGTLSAAALVPGLTCGGGMALCMWLMHRGSRSTNINVDADRAPSEPGAEVKQRSTPNADARIAVLEAEVARLRNAHTPGRQSRI